MGNSNSLSEFKECAQRNDVMKSIFIAMQDNKPDDVLKIIDFINKGIYKYDSSWTFSGLMTLTNKDAGEWHHHHPIQWAYHVCLCIGIDISKYIYASDYQSSPYKYKTISLYVDGMKPVWLAYLLSLMETKKKQEKVWTNVFNKLIDICKPSCGDVIFARPQQITVRAYSLMVSNCVYPDKDYSNYTDDIHIS
jgi:hypothetical protein